MNSNNIYLKYYAKKFGYVSDDSTGCSYTKNTREGSILMLSSNQSKYVEFFFNEKNKTFRKGDLFLAVLNETPVAWEAEYV